MKRRNFIKLFGIGSVTALTVPAILIATAKPTVRSSLMIIKARSRGWSHERFSHVLYQHGLVYSEDYIDTWALSGRERSIPDKTIIDQLHV